MGSYSILNCVLYQGLQDQMRNGRGECRRFYSKVHTESVFKAHLLYFEITPQEFYFLLECDHLFVRVLERQPQEVAEPSNHAICPWWVFQHERRDRVKRVEKKMRMKLHLERLELSLS